MSASTQGSSPIQIAVAAEDGAQAALISIPDHEPITVDFEHRSSDDRTALDLLTRAYGAELAARFPGLPASMPLGTTIVIGPKDEIVRRDLSEQARQYQVHEERKFRKIGSTEFIILP